MADPRFGPLLDYLVSCCVNTDNQVCEDLRFPLGLSLRISSGGYRPLPSCVSSSFHPSYLADMLRPFNKLQQPTYAAWSAGGRIDVARAEASIAEETYIGRCLATNAEHMIHTRIHM